MCFREVVVAELGETINVFHDVSPAFCTVTSIHRKAGFLQTSINVFHSKNLTFFTVASEMVEQPEPRKRERR